MFFSGGRVVGCARGGGEVVAAVAQNGLYVFDPSGEEVLVFYAADLDAGWTLISTDLGWFRGFPGLSVETKRCLVGMNSRKVQVSAVVYVQYMPSAFTAYVPGKAAHPGQQIVVSRVREGVYHARSMHF